MAYFCLTVLQWGVAEFGRDRAAAAFNIQREILGKLGKLATKRGDAQTARKLEKDSSYIPLTPVEEKWIHTAVRAIIRRIGEYETLGSAETLPQITMEDLPELPPDPQTHERRGG